ncbi:MAG TPA: hypothetical protein VKU41_19475 [Polyangiaceae bacterium]|nr:hypothetical protein [Polyangiaceae bacterium]
MQVPPAFDPLRLWEHVHGHLGWLAAAAVTHPAILLRPSRDGGARRATLSVALAVAFLTLAGAFGVAMYPAYRESLRAPLFAQAPTIGYLFERKEHLAFGAILFGWAGGAGYAGSLRAQGHVRSALRRAAHVAFVAAAAIAFVTAVLGTIVSTYKTF